MPPSSQEIKKVFSILEKDHPLTMLEELGDYTPFQMLVMTMLSARTKDKTTIPLVKDLFSKYPTPQSFLTIPLPLLEKKLFGIGFYKIKARNLKLLSSLLMEKFQGNVPDTFDELVSLPGIGRKTANCILAYTFHKPAIAVDTHVHRISNRLSWIITKTPEETEEKLQQLVPKESWIDVNRLLVGHGQTICTSLRPHCHICPILQYCKYGQKEVKKKIR